MRAATPPVAATALTAYARTPPPARTTPWREADFCVLDLETTGLDPGVDEIISFAALQVVGGRVRPGSVHYRLVRPRRMPDAETIRIHGLRRTDLVDAPALSEVLDGLLEALSGKGLVAHVASIETGFLNAALQTHGIQLVNPVVDTAALAAELFRRRSQPVLDSASVGLSPLARALGLPVHRPHHADGDALTTAQVFLALATHLDALERQTIGSLERYAKRAGTRPTLRSTLARVVAGLPRRAPRR